MKQPATLPTLRRQGAALTVLALAVVLAALAGLCFGSQGYTPLQLWQAWCSGDPQNAVYRVLLHVRWPRTLAGLLAGSALAAAGVLLQAVLNNAMASPNVIGVNAGAGLAALCAAALWPAHPNAVQPAAFAGALAAALLVYGLALGAGVSRTTLVLAGLAVSGMLTAGMNTIKLLYPDAIAGASDFLVGGLSGVTLSGLKGAVPYLITGTLLALLLAADLNVLCLGEQSAASLGLHIGAVRFFGHSGGGAAGVPGGACCPGRRRRGHGFRPHGGGPGPTGRELHPGQLVPGENCPPGGGYRPVRHGLHPHPHLWGDL